MKRIRPFDTRQLEAFDTLVLTGSFTEATRRLCRSSDKSFDADARGRGGVSVIQKTRQESVFTEAARDASLRSSIFT